MLKRCQFEELEYIARHIIKYFLAKTKDLITATKLLV